LSPAPVSADADRVIADLRELASLSSNATGAQRVAWGPTWRQARRWFRKKVEDLGLAVTTDAAGNNWVNVPGTSPRSLVIGSHLDSVPDAGWLDGALGVLAGLQILRRQIAVGQPPLTLRLVDWADEEGRFGRSLLGSSAAAGTLDIDQIASLADKTGTKLADGLRENGIALERLSEARQQFQQLQAAAYLELHIEQGPILESLGKSTGVVLGTFGVERHLLRWVGQAAHSGSTPIPLRRDAFLAAAEFALECRTIAQRHSRSAAGAVCTIGRVRVEPDIATAVPGLCEITLDQRALDASVLKIMLTEARAASQRIAQSHRVAVEWQPLFRMESRPFDPGLIELCAASVREVTGEAPRLPSGPLHDASEMARLVPTVMMFASSTNGLSHCKEEDTPLEHLDRSIRAFFLLVDRTMQQLA
jgi:N-carbamoyl-L-amino-acid hydrolase